MTDDVHDGPLPARHLVDLQLLPLRIEGHRATSLIAQLGCPFGCGFCGGRNSKSAAPDPHPHDRIRSCTSSSSCTATYGFTGFMFYDDELNVSKSSSS